MNVLDFIELHPDVTLTFKEEGITAERFDSSVRIYLEFHTRDLDYLLGKLNRMLEVLASSEA